MYTSRARGSVINSQKSETKNGLKKRIMSANRRLLERSLSDETVSPLNRQVEKDKLYCRGQAFDITHSLKFQKPHS